MVCKRSALENDLEIQIIDWICTLEAQKTQQRTSQKVHGLWCLWVPSIEKVMWQKTPGSMAHYILPLLNMTKPWFLDFSGLDGGHQKSCPMSQVPEVAAGCGNHETESC